MQFIQVGGPFKGKGDRMNLNESHYRSRQSGKVHLRPTGRFRFSSKVYLSNLNPNPKPNLTL